MNKICTSIEQSKKLIELGIDRKSSDMYWWYTSLRYYIEAMDDGDFNEAEGHIPAWSLTALMNLLPSEFTEVGKYSTTKYEINIRKYKLTDEVNLHQIAYGSYKWHEDGGYTWSDMINTGEKEELLDAAFEMVCWLKEKNKI